MSLRDYGIIKTSERQQICQAGLAHDPDHQSVMSLQDETEDDCPLPENQMCGVPALKLGLMAPSLQEPRALQLIQTTIPK